MTNIFFGLYIIDTESRNIGLSRSIKKLRSKFLRQKQLIASVIYNSLQTQRGKASLTGFYTGEVIYPDAGFRVKIIPLGIPDSYEEDMFRARFFTEKDMESGITAIIVSEFSNPKWPHEPFKDEAVLRYLNISGTGKIVEGGLEKPYQDASLNSMEMDALAVVSQLSIIPRQILEVFGSYRAFLRALGLIYLDMEGIDYAERTPMQILYNGGLEQFVRALEFKEKGQLDELGTSLHQLKDSLDPRDHFTTLFEILQRCKKGD